MMKKYIIFILVSFVLMFNVAPTQAQSKNDRWHIRKGNKLFRQGRVDDAATEYRKALEVDSLNSQAVYNMGRTLLQKGIKLFPNEQAEYKSMQENVKKDVDSLFQQANKMFMSAAQLENNPIRKAMSWHNIGWSFQKQEKFQDAIEAYKEALRNNPHDEDTRYNLALCQWQLKKQQDENDNQQDQNNQQDNKDNNQNQNQDKDQQQNQDQNQQQNQDQKQDQDNQQQNQQGEGRQDQPQMSEQNMQRMLDAVNRKEQETQARLEKAKSARQTRTLDKNW